MDDNRNKEKVQAREALIVPLDYANRGWAVFPLYAVKDGVCTCQDKQRCKRPGKHPRTHTGLKRASTGPKAISGNGQRRHRYGLCERSGCYRHRPTPRWRRDYCQAIRRTRRTSTRPTGRNGRRWLRKLKCAQVSQDGDHGELTAIFDVDDLPKVAKIIRPRGRRQLSARQRAELANRLRPVRKPTPQVPTGGQYTAQGSDSSTLGDSEDAEVQTVLF